MLDGMRFFKKKLGTLAIIIKLARDSHLFYVVVYVTLVLYPVIAGLFVVVMVLG